MSLLLANLVLLLLALQPAVAFAAVGDGTQHHQRQSLYQNVFFSELPRMKGRPSTSFVMVRTLQIIPRLVLKVKMYPCIKYNDHGDDYISTKYKCKLVTVSFTSKK